MKTVFVLFDSLNRHMLGAYGGTRIPTPNFDRLAERCVTFDRHYVGSMPCIPARRDMLTGRLSFLHRSWGPMEPFDNAFPVQLYQAGVYSHLVTDHYHYWEDGGATYHNRYDSYEFVRGQEGDAVESDGAAALGTAARDVPRAPVRHGAAHLSAQEHGQSRIHPRGIRFSVRSGLRPRPGIPRTEPRRRKLVPADRDLRPARAVPRPGALQGAVRDRLERADSRLAALRPRRRTAGRMRGTQSQLLRRRLAVRLSARPSCSTTSTVTTCGRTPRWW